MHKAKLAEAAMTFSKAVCSSKSPARHYRKTINALLMEAWQETTGKGKKMSGKVSIEASHLYTLLHQAVQNI